MFNPCRAHHSTYWLILGNLRTIAVGMNPVSAGEARGKLVHHRKQTASLHSRCADVGNDRYSTGSAQNRSEYPARKAPKAMHRSGGIPSTKIAPQDIA